MKTYTVELTHVDLAVLLDTLDIAVRDMDEIDLKLTKAYGKLYDQFEEQE